MNKQHSFLKKNLIYIHFDPPTSSTTMQLRLKVSHSFGSIMSNHSNDSSSSNENTNPPKTSAPSSSSSIRHILLDGISPPSNSPSITSSLIHINSINDSLSEVIPNSDRNIIQATVNAAFRAHNSETGSDRQTSAKEKLLANIIRIKNIRIVRRRDCKLNKEGKEEELMGDATIMIEKMKIIGMICEQGSSKKSKGRELAMTRWLDRAEGRSYGATWSGSIRFGASFDASSNALALHRNSATLSQSCQISGCLHAKYNTTSFPRCNLADTFVHTNISHEYKIRKERKMTACWYNRALFKWNPNPSNGNPYRAIEKEDDTYDHIDDESLDPIFSDSLVPAAKACGHNETSMFFLRPFASLEVLNSRVCSLCSPAPGNDGFEGCLDFLRRMCSESERGMYFWDNETFSYIDGRQTDKEGKARVLSLKKERLLKLKPEHLYLFVEAMRQWSLSREKKRITGCDPTKLAQGIQLIFKVASILTFPGNESRKALDQIEELLGRKNRTSILPQNTFLHILLYVIPGSPQLWSSANITSLNI